MKPLDPLLVDGSVLDRYLSRLAETTAQVLSRFDKCEKRFDSLQNEFNQIKNKSIRDGLSVKDNGKEIAVIQHDIRAEKFSSTKVYGVASDKLEIKGDFHGGRLVWRFQIGSNIKKGQVVAMLMFRSNIGVKFDSVAAPADGMLVEKLFDEGANLYGSNIVVGYMKPL